MSNKLSMRVATHALIAALTITTGGIGAVTLAAPAIAADGDNAYTPKIETGRKGTLTIHKKADPKGPLGTPTGKTANNVSGANLGGVTFQLQKLKYDITKTADLKAAEAVDPTLTPLTYEEGNAPANANSKAPVLAEKEVTKTASTPEGTKENPSSGEATFDELPLGVYLVTETEAPAGYQKSAPFMVFIPMTDQTPADESNPWLYDVVAYPKNTKFKVTKDLAAGEANKNANVGDDISYVVTGDRPAINKSEKYVSYYELIDIVPDGLKFDSVVVKIGDNPPLTAGPDYTLDQTDSGKVKVRLTNAGLQTLTRAEAGEKVEATFTFKVNSVDGNAYTATNIADAVYDTKPYPTPPADPADPEVPESNRPDKTPTDPQGPGDQPKVKETWIPVLIKKHGATEAETLGGAVFNVFRCVQDPNNEKTGTTKGEKLSVNKITEFTTSREEGPEKGQVKIDALRLRKDRAANDGYCLVETKAPAGYELLPEPVFFRLPDTPDGGKPAVFDLPVENVPSVGPKLPATGGMGVGILVAIGALITGAGAFFARRNTKKA